MRRTRGRKIDVVYKWKTSPKFPVRLWFGKYCAWKSLMVGRDCEKRVSKYIGDFLDTFPKRNSLEKFTSVDVADYQFLRKKQGYCQQRIVNETAYIRAFWQWLIEQKGLPLRNIVDKFEKPKFYWHFPKVSKRNQERSIQEAEKLLEKLTDPRAKRIVIRIMQGTRNCHVHSFWRRKIYAAAAEAGLENFRLSQFKLITRSAFARDVVKAYCDQLLNALPVEPQLPSDSLTTVDAAASDERPPVRYSHRDLTSGRWIPQQEPSAEG